jgi:hypothetical protein
MRHANLNDLYPSNAQTNEQLCREEGAVRVHADFPQRVTAEEFRGAVNVADTQSEPDAIRNTVERGVDEAQQRIGALQAISNYNWRMRSLSTRNKSRKVGHAKLAVTIGVGKIVVPCRCKA